MNAQNVAAGQAWLIRHAHEVGPFILFCIATTDSTDSVTSLVLLVLAGLWVVTGGSK